MDKLVYSVDKVIKHLYVGLSCIDIVINGRVYRKNRRFLGYELKPRYYYTINVPFVQDPSYDEKRNTNKVLSIYAAMLKQELKDKIYELKEQDNKHY